MVQDIFKEFFIFICTLFLKLKEIFVRLINDIKGLHLILISKDDHTKPLTEKVSKLEDKENLVNTFRITVNNKLNKQDNKQEDDFLFRVGKSNTIEFVKKKN